MQMYMIIPGSQSIPEVEVYENTSDVQGLQTLEHVTSSPDSPRSLKVC
jgi:hypothetical protein